MKHFDSLGVVIIGRNEGERLVRCLASVRDFPHRVYVDSGSTDGSVEMAERQEIIVRRLQTPPKFTAARARNEGIRALLQSDPGIEYVFTVDGDCEVQSRWIEAGVAVLEGRRDLAIVFGRRRERFPDRSVYNAICDDEWNQPVGEAAGCGGDAIFRVEAWRSVGGYCETMIAGEDSELSMRLRKRGWRLWRIDVEMTLHDAGLLRFGQWWNRAKRSGYGYADMAWRHPDAVDPNWTRSCWSIALWGGIAPLLILLLLPAVFLQPLWALIAAVPVALWLLKVAQLFSRQLERKLPPKVAAWSALLLMVGKVAQFEGLARFYTNRLLRRSGKLIEYKGPGRS